MQAFGVGDVLGDGDGDGSGRPAGRAASEEEREDAQAPPAHGPPAARRRGRPRCPSRRPGSRGTPGPRVVRGLARTPSARAVSGGTSRAVTGPGPGEAQRDDARPRPAASRGGARLGGRRSTPAGAKPWRAGGAASPRRRRRRATRTRAPDAREGAQLGGGRRRAGPTRTQGMRATSRSRSGCEAPDSMTRWSSCVRGHDDVGAVGRGGARRWPPSRRPARRPVVRSYASAGRGHAGGDGRAGLHAQRRRGRGRRPRRQRTRTRRRPRLMRFTSVGLERPLVVEGTCSSRSRPASGSAGRLEVDLAEGRAARPGPPAGRRGGRPVGHDLHPDAVALDACAGRGRRCWRPEGAVEPCRPAAGSTKRPSSLGSAGEADWPETSEPARDRGLRHVHERRSAARPGPRPGSRGRR